MKKILDFFKKIEAWVFRLFDKIADTAVGEWLGEGTRWAWLLVGLAIGFWSDSFYCACWAGAVGIGAYTCFYRTEWKQKFSFLVVGLMIALSMAGYGLAYILTEQ